MWFPFFLFLYSTICLSLCLTVRSAPLRCSPQLVDLPEIKGNHRKFRTLVTSYIGRYWIVGLYFSCMSVVVLLLQWLNFTSFVTSNQALMYVDKVLHKCVYFYSASSPKAEHKWKLVSVHIPSSRDHRHNS
jgi:hypothetical protein